VRGVVLRVEEREVISRELAGGLSCRAIAVVLGRHQSVVSREVDRHGGRGSYRAVAAQECADRDRGRPNERVLVENKRLHEAVRDGLADKWSPRQVSRRLPEQFPGDQTLRVSHEAIYQTLYLQARGELRTQLSLALRPGPGPAGEPVPGGGQGEHRGHGEHQRTAGGSRGPGGARVLGRGSDHRAGWAQPDRDAGRGGGAPGT